MILRGRHLLFHRLLKIKIWTVFYSYRHEIPVDGTNTGHFNATQAPSLERFLNCFSFCHSKDNEYPGTPTAMEASLSLLLIKLIQPTLKAQNSASLQISTLRNFICNYKTSSARILCVKACNMTYTVLFKKLAPCFYITIK